MTISALSEVRHSGLPMLFCMAPPRVRCLFEFFLFFLPSVPTSATRFEVCVPGAGARLRLGHIWKAYALRRDS